MYSSRFETLKRCDPPDPLKGMGFQA